MLQLFQTRDAQFIFSSHLSILVALFLLYHQKIFIPYIVLVTLRLSLFCNETLFSALKYIVYTCVSCFRPGMGQFIFFVTLIYTCHTFFAASSENNYVPYILLCTVRLSLFRNRILFLLLKYIVYKCYSCFRPGMGQFIFIVTLVYTCRAFFAVSSKNIYPIYCFVVLVTLRLSLFCNETLFSALSSKNQVWANFFLRHTYLHLSHFFRCIVRKYLSHIFFCAQFVSVYFAIEFFFSF